jgi:hypothetical protein
LSIQNKNNSSGINQQQETDKLRREYEQQI